MSFELMARIVKTELLFKGKFLIRQQWRHVNKYAYILAYLLVSLDLSIGLGGLVDFPLERIHGFLVEYN